MVRRLTNGQLVSPRERDSAAYVLDFDAVDTRLHGAFDERFPHRSVTDASSRCRRHVVAEMCGRRNDAAKTGRGCAAVPQPDNITLVEEYTV